MWLFQSGSLGQWGKKGQFNRKHQRCNGVSHVQNITAKFNVILDQNFLLRRCIMYCAWEKNARQDVNFKSRVYRASSRI